MIRTMTASDWPEVASVYAHGIATGDATFEEEVPTWRAWDASHLGACRLVFVDDDEVLGWVALSPVSDRCAYQGVAEVSLYVAAGARGRGIGSDLLRRLIECSEAEGIWTLQAGIFPENVSSLGIHHRLGFRTVGTRERLGILNGRWRDVVLLERRSEVAGR
jgi:phosphinothricin acetyltransferase